MLFLDWELSNAQYEFQTRKTNGSLANFSKGSAAIFARSGSHYTKAVALKMPTPNRGWGLPQASTQMYGGGMKKFQMINFDMKISQSALLMFGFTMGLGVAPELYPEVWSRS